MRILMLVVLLTTLTGCVPPTQPQQIDVGAYPIHKDAYGMGVSSDAYGRPVTTNPLMAPW